MSEPQHDREAGLKAHSKAQRDRITAEETFRYDLRSQLKNGAQARGPMLEFLNSPFGLFLLSSVLIAGLGRAYAEYQSGVNERENSRRELVELLSEIDLRTIQSEVFASRIEQGSSPEVKRASCVMLWRVVVADREYQPTSPRFRYVHWAGLITRARVLTGIDNSHAATQAAVQVELATNSGTCDRELRPQAQIRILRAYTNWLYEFVSD